jgi:hypothetical protein
MKRIILCGLVVTIWCTAGGSRQTPTQVGAARAVRADLTEKERVRRWLAFNSPGAAHQRMAVLAGKWDVAWTVWDEPGTRPTIARGSASFDWLHDRRYLKGRYDGEVVGHRYDAELLLGYDSFRGTYVAIWTNSLETAPLIYRGRARLDARRNLVGWELKGKGDDCVHGRFDLDYRAVFAVEANGDIRETIYGPDTNGREFKSAELVYTRPGAKIS